MGLLKWLRHKLREWLLDDFEDNNDLEVIIDGRFEKATATQTAGLQLVCLIKSTKQEMLISPFDALSESRYWKVWSRIGGDNQLTWEDGTSCIPEDIDLT